MKLYLKENINTPSDEQENTMSKVKRAINNFAGQITVNSDLEKDVGEFLLKKGISFMKDDSNLSKGKITFKLGYKKLKESYPINAFSDAQSKTYDRLDNILSKFKSLDRKYVPRKSIDGTDKVMLSKSGKDFVNIYKDGSFEILDDNGKVIAKVKDINDFSDNDLGVIFKKELNIEESLKEDWRDEINPDLSKETEFNISDEYDVSSDMEDYEIKDIIEDYLGASLGMDFEDYKYKFNSDGDLIVYDVKFLGPYDERRNHRAPLKIKGSDFEDYLGYWMANYNYGTRDKYISYDLESIPIEISYIAQEEMDDDDLYQLAQLANKWLSLNGYLGREVLIKAHFRGGPIIKAKFKVSKGNDVTLIDDTIFVVIDMEATYGDESIFKSFEEAKEFAEGVIKENKENYYSFYIYKLTESEWNYYYDNDFSVYDDFDPEEIINSEDILGEDLKESLLKIGLFS